MSSAESASEETVLNLTQPRNLTAPTSSEIPTDPESTPKNNLFIDDFTANTDFAIRGSYLSMNNNHSSLDSLSFKSQQQEDFFEDF